ncbi:MAG: DUF1501 domain-containing protein [Planctomycetes bacterium]|nr:DUF1501 domain-containing protein [Planctomycetota bacterium]
MLLTRRDLFRIACAAGVGLAFPDLLHAGGVAASPDWQRSLVLVELDGGNDGLNMAVPYTDPTYIAKRSTLRVVPNATTIALGNATFQIGPNPGDISSGPLILNPVMSRPSGLPVGLSAAWAANELAVVLGLGMANPNRSHFHGIDVWNSGSNSTAVLSDGWLRRILAGTAPVPSSNLAAHTVLLERANSNPVAGTGVRNLAMGSPQAFLRDAASITTLPVPGTNPALQRVISTNNDVASARQIFASKLTPTPTFAASFPAGAFGDQCRSVAEMISAGLGIPVYKMHLGGFDNHANQRAKHDDLLAQLAHGLAGLRAALIEKGWWNRTLIATYSEFGRRIEQNGSDGTDHGTAAPHLVLGHAANINGGLFGRQPGLAYPDDRGDLRQTMDYRRLYATASRFLGYDATSSLGGSYAPVGSAVGEPTPLLKP